MTDLPARRFNETDTDAILRRAAELSTGGEESPAGRGLTIEEMEALARDAGLDPELVRRAAREVGVRQAQAVSPWAGAPRRIVIEQEISRELTEELWESMVGEVRRTIGEIGMVSQVGRTRTWTMVLAAPRGPTTRMVSLTATSHGGKTTIRIEEQLNQLAGALFGGIVGGYGGGSTGIWLGIGLGALHSPAVAVGLLLANLIGSYSLARRLFIRAYRKRSDELAELAVRLAEARPLDG
jgi:hypothetical protein